MGCKRNTADRAQGTRDFEIDENGMAVCCLSTSALTVLWRARWSYGSCGGQASTGVDRRGWEWTGPGRSRNPEKRTAKGGANDFGLTRSRLVVERLFPRRWFHAATARASKDLFRKRT